MKTVGEKSSNNFINALLYSTESITALLFSLVSISLIARHFGPDIFARYSVVQAVSTLFIVFATLGLEQFIIKTLARDKHDAEYVTSILMGMFAGWLLYAALVGGYYLIFSDFSRDLFLLVNVVISTLFLRVVFVKSYLQAQNSPKPIAMASLVSRLLSMIYLVAGVYFDFSFDAMMVYLPLQAFTMMLMMSISQPAFFRLIKLRHFNLQRLISSTREASPIFLSTVLYFFYSQSDILIMSNLLDATTVGVYSASIRLIPLAAFIGYAVVSTFYVEMDKKLLADKDVFEIYVRSLLTIQFGMGIVLAVGVFMTSDLIINLLYGAQYAESARVLGIACWAWVFIMPAALYSRLLVMLGYARYELIKMLIIAPLIILLNYLVISSIGMIGSAIVCVFSYFLVDFLVYFLFKDTRYLGMMGLKALTDIFIKPRQSFHMSMSLLKARHGS